MAAQDKDVPALIVRTGVRTWDYGALATVRTLGRLGVPVYVQGVPAERELVASGYLTGIVGAPIDPAAQPAAQVEHLNAAVATIGRDCVAIAGDDESAVLLAERHQAIDSRLITSGVEADLPRTLSDKVSLGRLCAQAGVPYPRFVSTGDPGAIQAFVRQVGLPVVLKSPAPFERLSDTAVPKTMLVTAQVQLFPWLELATRGREIFVQEYLGGDHDQLWYAAGVSASQRVHVWTGRKVLAHPRGTGIGVVNLAAAHSELKDHTRALCDHIGYRGPFDTDWVVNPVTGRAQLIDFNPRRGAQFRTFVTTTGLDVVRAVYLEATEVPIDAGEQVNGRVHVVENLAVLQGAKGVPWRYRTPGVPMEFSWYARDDARPARSIAAQMMGIATRKLGQRLPRW